MKPVIVACLSLVVLGSCSGSKSGGGGGQGGRGGQAPTPDAGVDAAATGGRAATGGSAGTATGGSGSTIATGGVGGHGPVGGAAGVAATGGAGGVPTGGAGGVPTGGASGVPTGGAAAGAGGGNGGTPASGGGGSASPGGASGAAGTGPGGGSAAGGVGAGGASVPTRANTCAGIVAPAVANAHVATGFCAYTWADNVNAVRGIAVDSNGDVLAVESGAARVILLHDANGDGQSDATERVTLATQPGLNHGIVLGGGFLYASTPTTVYRWAYTTGARTSLGPAETVVSGIPSGGHSTRTLRLAANQLYVSIGSGSNLDADAARAAIRRFDLSSAIPSGGLAFSSGQIFADGMRNEVGLAFDSRNRLWGVENGTDDVARPDLGDVHEDNPAEELNLFAEAGHFYGYPYCWSEYLLPSPVGMGPGTQWAHQSFWMDGTHTDAWCRNPANVVPPVATMPAHTAPLGIAFYGGGSFPTAMEGGAFVALHGSWDRTIPIGYSVVYFPFTAGTPAGPMQPFFEFAGPGATGATWPHRPVDVAVGMRGQLFVTSDASNSIFWIGHNGT
jgi:glucose/arabinose dehydrogenase